MPFNVELPEHFGQPQSEAAPAGGSESPQGASPEGAQSTESSTKAATTEVIKEILDLDKVDRFRFDGKEWSPKDLKNSYLMREDYTRKTQELAETRKYADNFAVDLQTVLKYPHRLEEFKKLYPKEYVAAAERVIASRNPSQTQDVPNQPGASQGQPQKDPMLMSQLAEMQEKLSAWEQSQYQASVEKAQAWLDSQYEQLSKKYPMADSDVVSSLASVAADKGTQITKEFLEKLFKDHDSKTQVRWEKVYKTKVDEQLKTGSKSKDIGAGGGTPGSAPKGFKTIKDATRQFLEDVGSKSP